MPSVRSIGTCHVCHLSAKLPERDDCRSKPLTVDSCKSKKQVDSGQDLSEQSSHEADYGGQLPLILPFHTIRTFLLQSLAECDQIHDEYLDS